jgi:hypothetical protein
MNSRERTLALILGVLILFFVLGGGGYAFYSAYKGGQDNIKVLEKELEETNIKVRAVVSEQPRLNRWRRLSLPSDVSKARSEYNQYLRNLMKRTGMLEQSITADKNEFRSAILHPTKPNKIPIYTGLTFDVDARASMTTLIAFLKDFQSTSKMHRIKRLTIDRSEIGAATKQPKGKGPSRWEDPPDLMVKITIEALIILDADVLQKRTKIADRAILIAEALSALRGGPTGQFLAAWAIGPSGPEVPPINMPLLSVRNYDDLPKRNIFKGRDPIVVDENAKIVPLADEEYNVGMFRTFLSLVTEYGPRGQTISVEAKLWDWRDSPKLGTKIIKTSPGFNRIPIVQTRDKTLLIYGQVVKISNDSPREIVFKVGLNAADPSSSKWWRYPKDENFYRLHKDDVAALVASKKVKEDDYNQLYLVSDGYWEDMVTKTKVHMSSDKKTFHFPGSSGWGDVVYRDSAVLIIKMFTWPPYGSPAQPSLAASRLYPDGGQIYSIHQNHLAQLIAAGKRVKESEIDRIFVLNSNFYDYLHTDKLIMTPGGLKFTFFNNLLRGDIIEQNDDVVVLRVAEQYCQYPGEEYKVGADDTPKKIAPYWHAGYCSLRVGQKVQEALLRPLTATQIQEVLAQSVVVPEPNPRRAQSFRARRPANSGEVLTSEQ